MNSFIQTLGLAILFGICYTVFFLMQKRYLLSLRYTKRHHILHAIAMTAPRIILFAFCYGYLLLSSAIHPILFIIFFFVTFWLTLMARKATL